MGSVSDFTSNIIQGSQLHRTLRGYNFGQQTPRVVLRGWDGSNQQCGFPLTEDALSTHIMLLGQIGIGKSTTFFHIIDQLSKTMTPNDVMIVFDTKGDFRDKFYRKGDIIISNDRTATGPDGPNYWNIFNEIDKKRPTESVIEISKSLFAEQCKKTSQIFFPNAARDIFGACLMHFLRSVPPAKQTNKNLIDYINSTPTSKIKEMLTGYDDLRVMTNYISNPDSPQTQGVMSELIQSVRSVFIGNFAKHGSLALKSTVSKKGGRKAFIEYDLGIGKMLSPIYSLMFDMSIKQALSRAQGGNAQERGNVFFITDEFSLLPNLEHIDDAVNFGRSLGIKFMIGVQNVEQIYDNYGEARARSIMSGFLTNISFRVTDGKSREYIQQLYGKSQISESYTPMNKLNGAVEHQREANVVEDWDITTLRRGQAIVGLQNAEPFLFQFSPYSG